MADANLAEEKREERFYAVINAAELARSYVVQAEHAALARDFGAAEKYAGYVGEYWADCAHAVGGVDGRDLDTAQMVLHGVEKFKIRAWEASVRAKKWQDKPDYGKMPLHEAALQADSPAVIVYHLRQGADVNGEDEHGWTPLRYAIETGSPQAVDVLIKNGAYVNAKDGGGKTPLDYAQDDKNVFPLSQSGARIIQLLRAANALTGDELAALKDRAR